MTAISPTSGPFDAFPQPEWNDHASVDAGLQALRDAGDEASAAQAHDTLLWALGNNHAGTYYPVALAVLPALEKILMDGQDWPRRAAIESMIDLGGAFAPENGHGTYLGASVQGTLRAAIRAMRPRVAALAAGGGACAESAEELLELIDDLDI